MERDSAIEQAAAAAGGITRLSTALGLSRTAVSGWRRVPAERVLAVERISGVSRYVLRPDLYPDRREESQQVACQRRSGQMS